MVVELNDSERAVLTRLRATGEVLTQALDKELAPWGVSAFEYAILDALTDVDPHLMRLTTLAEVTHGTLPRVSRAVASLQRGGLVDKVACPSDGRAINAVLTADGEAVHRRGGVVYADVAHRMVFADLEGEDSTHLARLLAAVMGRLDASDGRGGC